MFGRSLSLLNFRHLAIECSRAINLVFSGADRPRGPDGGAEAADGFDSVIEVSLDLGTAGSEGRRLWSGGAAECEAALPECSMGCRASESSFAAPGATGSFDSVIGVSLGATIRGIMWRDAPW